MCVAGEALGERVKCRRFVSHVSIAIFAMQLKHVDIKPLIDHHIERDGPKRQLS